MYLKVIDDLQVRLIVSASYNANHQTEEKWKMYLEKYDILIKEKWFFQLVSTNKLKYNCYIVFMKVVHCFLEGQ